MQQTSTSRFLFVFLAMITAINGILTEKRTPDPAGCPSDQFLAKLTDGTWDCLFCTLSCPPGTEEETQCTRERDLQCRECPDGTFNDGSTTTCKNCSVCLRVATNCSSTNDRVCKKYAANEEESYSLRIVSIAAVFVATSVTVLVIGIIVGLTYWYMRKRRKNNPILHTMENKSRTEEVDVVNQSLIKQVSPAAQTSNIVEHSTSENEDGVKNHEVNDCNEDKGCVVTQSSVNVPPNSNNSNLLSTKNVLLQLVSYSATNDPTIPNFDQLRKDGDRQRWGETC